MNPLQEFVTSTTASLNIKNSVRKDSGIYKIEAKNDYGIDMADIEVVVVSKPGPPTGPIDYTTVTPDSVSMSWKPPLDDGGTPITGMTLVRNKPLKFICRYVLYPTVIFIIKIPAFSSAPH